MTNKDTISWIQHWESIDKTTHEVSTTHSYKITAKKEFLQHCPKPENCTPHELNLAGLGKFLHNTEGPAIESMEESSLFQSNYYLDGKRLTKEEWMVEVEHYKFHTKLETLADSDQQDVPTDRENDNNEF